MSEATYRAALIRIRDHAKSLGPDFAWVVDDANRTLSPPPPKTTGAFFYATEGYRIRQPA